MKIEPTPSELSELFIRGFKPVDEATRFEFKTIACHCAARPDIYDETTCINGMFLYNLLAKKDPVSPAFIKRFDLNLIVVAKTYSMFGPIWTAFRIKLSGDKRITALQHPGPLIDALEEAK